MRSLIAIVLIAQFGAYGQQETAAGVPEGHL